MSVFLIILLHTVNKNGCGFLGSSLWCSTVQLQKLNTELEQLEAAMNEVQNEIYMELYQQVSGTYIVMHICTVWPCLLCVSIRTCKVLAVQIVYCVLTFVCVYAFPEKNVNTVESYLSFCKYAFEVSMTFTVNICLQFSALSLVFFILYRHLCTLKGMMGYACVYFR